MASDLTSESELSCSNCAVVLLERRKITSWKDLPSEGWAEMMEFWHCHKPHEPDNGANGHVKKGYAADSKLAIETGVGMVEALDLLVFPADCSNIEVSFLNIYQFLSQTFSSLGQKEPATPAP